MLFIRFIETMMDSAVKVNKSFKMVIIEERFFFKKNNLGFVIQQFLYSISVTLTLAINSCKELLSQKQYKE